MAYDDDLADLLRALTSEVRGVTEKRMFGGLAFLVHGNMAIAASGRQGLLVRCAPEDVDALLAEPGVSRQVMQGRELRGWLHVDVSEAFTEADIRPWADRSVAYAASLPAKKPSPKPKRTAP